MFPALANWSWHDYCNTIFCPQPTGIRRAQPFIIVGDYYDEQGIFAERCIFLERLPQLCGGMHYKQPIKGHHQGLGHTSAGQQISSSDGENLQRYTSVEIAKSFPHPVIVIFCIERNNKENYHEHENDGRCSCRQQSGKKALF